MNRNLNAHYTSVPSLGVSRSVIVDKPRHLTTCNAGYVVPFHWQEIIPNSTLSFDTVFNIRSTPAVHATFDVSFCDVYYFFCPMRLIWDNFKHFIGEPEDYWTPSREYTVPQISFPIGGFSPGSVADHFGLPTLVDNRANLDGSNSVSALPFRAMAFIWNEYFRDEATMAPLYFSTGDEDIVGWQTGGSNIVNERVAHGAELPRASKPHDLFTSALLAPQRGPEVRVPIGNLAPVTTDFSAIASNSGYYSGNSPLVWGTVNSNGVPTIPNGRYDLQFYNNPSSGDTGTDAVSQSTIGVISNDVQPLNLVAHLDSATSATINDLRTAIAIQHIYEALALSGNRYREMLYHIWGVHDTNPNRDIPSYLGGNRIEITQNSIVQNSATSIEGSDTPLGNVAGYTHVTNRSNSFSANFLEHGILIGCFVIRQPKTYQQGINRQWLHKHRFDFYHPQLANIGYVGIKNMELYFGSYGVGSDSATNTEIFGYNEPFYEYRYQPSVITGAFRSNYPGGSLDSWHYADYYDIMPALSDDFVEDNSDFNIDRTLAVTSEVSDQFLVDICIKRTQVLPMPVYSVPGLERI